MKNAKLLSVILCLFIGTMSFVGCASGPNPTIGSASTIEEAHPDRFENTFIGMDVNDFKVIWPEAQRIGLSENDEIYQFIYTHLHPVIYGGYGGSMDYKIYTKFYFTNNKLVKYESTQSP